MAFALLSEDLEGSAAVGQVHRFTLALAFALALACVVVHERYFGDSTECRDK